MEVNNDLKLCYVERLPNKPKIKESIYRLYFTSNIDEVIGEDWDQPCSNVVTPPHEAYIDETYILVCKKLTLEVLEENDFYSYNDGADGVIALAWEEIENEGFHKRLVFQFGETTKSIEDKLFSREMLMKLEE